MSTTTIAEVVGTARDCVDGRLKVMGAATYPIDVTRDHRNGGCDRECRLSCDGHAGPLVADLHREGSRTGGGDLVERFVKVFGTTVTTTANNITLTLTAFTASRTP
jgi:hypothetical protein